MSLRQIESAGEFQLCSRVGLRFKLPMNDILVDSPQSDVWQSMVARLGGAEALAALSNNR